MCWVGLYRMWGGGAGLGATGAVGFCCRNTIRKSWWKLWKKKTFISISYLGSLCLCRRPGWQQLWCPGLRPWCWAPQRSTWDGRGGSRPSSCWHQWTQSKLRLRMCCRRAREHEVSFYGYKYKYICIANHFSTVKSDKNIIFEKTKVLIKYRQIKLQ